MSLADRFEAERARLTRVAYGRLGSLTEAEEVVQDAWLRLRRVDAGGFYVGFALLFAWAAITLHRQLVVPVCIAWSVAALLHFGYHVALDGFGTGDAIAQTAGLALVLALPVIAVAAVPRHPARSAAPLR